MSEECLKEEIVTMTDHSAVDEFEVRFFNAKQTLYSVTRAQLCKDASADVLPIFDVLYDYVKKSHCFPPTKITRKEIVSS